MSLSAESCVSRCRRELPRIWDGISLWFQEEEGEEEKKKENNKVSATGLGSERVNGREGGREDGWRMDDDVDLPDGVVVTSSGCGERSVSGVLFDIYLSYCT